MRLATRNSCCSSTPRDPGGDLALNCGDLGWGNDTDIWCTVPTPRPRLHRATPAQFLRQRIAFPFQLIHHCCNVNTWAPSATTGSPTGAACTSNRVNRARLSSSNADSVSKSVFNFEMRLVERSMNSLHSLMRSAMGRSRATS